MLRFSLNNQSRKIIFDLDDTLYSEKDYVKSALSFAGNLIHSLFNVAEAAQTLLTAYQEGIPDPIGAMCNAEMLPICTKSKIIAATRAHIPDIRLSTSAKMILDHLRNNSMGFGIITDGRSLTQRAKMAALGCLDADFVSISEEVQIPKTDTVRFLQVEAKFPSQSYCYVGDNPAKDFFAPNCLGWETIMLKNQGQNIHSQSIAVGAGYKAKIEIDSLSDLIGTIL